MQESCEVVSLGDADYMEFLQTATVVVVPLTKDTEPGARAVLGVLGGVVGHRTNRLT